MLAILPLKLLLVPSLIFGVTLAGRRWGPAVAGWLSAFPIVSGPILLALSLEQGSEFAAHAAEGTLLAVLAILVFNLVYAWASARFAVFGSMLCALLLYGLAVSGLQALQLPLLACFALVLAALSLAPRLFPRVAAPVPAGVKPANDLPWRMLAGALLVLAVTFMASRLGARLSGFMAMFPVMSTVLVGFSHYYSGRAFTVALLRGMVYGYFAFASFCLILAHLLRTRSVLLAFTLGIVGALAIQLLTRQLLQRAARAKAA